MQIKDKIWLAGFMDGEGSIIIDQTSKKWKSAYYPRVLIGNTHYKAMKYIQKLYKEKLNIMKRGNYKTFYHINFKGKNTLKVLKDIKPYLKVKKSQANLCLQLFRTLHKSNRKSINGRFQKLEINIITKRIKLFKTCKKLNN